nr:trans-aconitate 2-methyltransferase [Micromonospora sp. DSM 115978]
MWDPETYLRYEAERSRPFHDLLARVRATRPRAVVDLGCGPGNLTATLATRWPDARVTGIDLSPEMIRTATGEGSASRAVGGGGPGARFVRADVRDFTPGPEDDVLVCNAVLQWVPGHRDLLTRWATGLPPGGWLAVQVPGNAAAPSHRALRAVAAEPRWRDRLGDLGDEPAVGDAVEYATLLTGAGCLVDAWETTYLHRLPAGGADHPVLTWLEGTTLRPIRAALAGDWTTFRADLAGRLAEAYPVRHGVVFFPFRRILVVARVP